MAEKKHLAIPVASPVTVDHGAPVLAFDNFATLGHTAGMYSIVLSIGRPTGFTDNTAPTVHHVVAQLYGNKHALLRLRDAIDKSLTLGSESNGQPN